MQPVVAAQPLSTTGFQARSYADSRRYAKCIDVSRRVRWEIDRDVIRGRTFDFRRKFLPDGLSKVGELDFLSPEEQRLLSQIEGRTYANMFATIERAISSKMLEVARGHSLGDQVAFEALVRFTDEELKHQELFRRMDRMIGAEMPGGYTFVPRANDVAWLVLSKSSWAVLAHTYMAELVSLAHYRESIAWDGNLCQLFRDVFLFHWKEESQHVILDELEWRREDARLTPRERDGAVDDLIALWEGAAASTEQQAIADAGYFVSLASPMTARDAERVRDTLTRAYRRTFLLSGIEEERFAKTIATMITEEQGARIARWLEKVAT